MKALIEKNAARIIITSLIALVIVGIATGAALVPYQSDNYDPGHSLLEIGDSHYYFTEEVWTGGEKLLALQLDDEGDWLGRFEIRPGTNQGVLIREGGEDDPSELTALHLRSFSDHARVNFFPGGNLATGTINQLSLYADKVVIPNGISLAVDKKIYKFKCPATGGAADTCECVSASLDGDCGDTGLGWSQFSTTVFDFQCPTGYAVLNGGAWCRDGAPLRESRPRVLDETQWRISCNGTNVIGGAVITCTRIIDN